MLSSQSANYRAAAVAGLFYPENGNELRRMVDELLSSAEPFEPAPIKAMIVPHAGYVYSGSVAAKLYQQLRPQANTIRRVILLGPAHRVAFTGIATSSADYFRTPLGDVALDKAALAHIQDFVFVQQLDEAHRQEHSLEVQLPFLQRVLPNFTLVPLVVGECSGEQVAQLLEQLWGDEQTLVVISSDLSHFHSYDEANRRDRQTAQAILDLDPTRIGYGDACGRNPVNGLLRIAAELNLQVEQIALQNSGDSVGDKARVVGYGAYRFY